MSTDFAKKRSDLYEKDHTKSPTIPEKTTTGEIGEVQESAKLKERLGNAENKIILLTKDVNKKEKILQEIVKACQPLRGNPNCDWICKKAEEGLSGSQEGDR